MPNKKLEHINYNGTTYDLGITDLATTTTSGLMSASDKSKLDSIDPGAAGVSVTATYTTGTKIGTIAVGGAETELYTPTYTGNSPITVSGFTIKHANSGATASTYGESQGRSLAFGASFQVLAGTVNATGHLTALAARTMTLPSISIETNSSSGTKVAKITLAGTDYQLYAPQNTNTTYTLTKSGDNLVLTPSSGNAQTVTLNLATTGTNSANGLMSSADKARLDAMSDNANYTTMTPTITNGKALAVFNADGADTTIYDSRDIYYGTCATASGTQAKVVTTQNSDFVLTTGAMVRVKFTNANGYDGTATLNVDGTGAKNITRVGTTTTTRYWWTAGEVVDFVYDGTNFVMSNKGAASTTYYGLTKLSNSHTSTSQSVAATASAVKDAYDRGSAAYTLAEGKSTVNSIVPTYTTGTLINKLTVDGNEYNVYIPPYPTVSDLGLSKALKFVGFSTTAITDGQTTTPTISGVTGYTPAVGDVVIDNSNSSSTTQYEYVYTTANKWERLGGDNNYALAGEEYDVTNGGNNAASAVTISPKTTSIYSMTSTGSVENGTEASFAMSVSNEKLTFTFNTNSPTVVTLPGRSSVINAWTGYNTGVSNTYAAAQTFTPTTKKITLT